MLYISVTSNPSMSISSSLKESSVYGSSPVCSSVVGDVDVASDGVCRAGVSSNCMGGVPFCLLTKAFSAFSPKIFSTSSMRSFFLAPVS